MGDMKKEPKMTERIKVNKIRCKLCGDVIESKNVHHMVWCRCGAVAADGGTAYLKRAWNPTAFEEAGISKPTQVNITKPQGIFFDELSIVEEVENV